MASQMAICCHEFLEIYSDYRDGLIQDEETAARIRNHLDECIRCMGYDALVSRGVMALRGTSDVRPSRQLRRALDQRFAHPGPTHALTDHVRAPSAGIMAGLMVAGILIIVGWAGTTFLMPRLSSQETAAQQRQDSSRSVLVVANPGVPFVGFTDLNVPAFPESATVAPRRISFGTWVNLSR